MPTLANQDVVDSYTKRLSSVLHIRSLFSPKTFLFVFHLNFVGWQLEKDPTLKKKKKLLSQETSK